ncbi:Mpo1 family 2-hydroxy fatty acid dioxygenase [Acinetobacter portensis]|uniref:Mpo1 family 2-hydroxy fatty acid dioxygenase n=1 Tax=Acinetobacter portensis TaxID=1839785 RepID=UPI0013D80B58|nr:Mpo1-like protein [Acinetobacter portensis]
MTRLEKLLSQYAAYHLDRKNVFTHFIGIPLIVFAILCLTAKAGFVVAGFPITLALLLIVASVIYYLSLDLIFGVVMAAIFAIAYPYALMITEMSITHWLTLSISTFVIGWIFQFVGHFYEKKKPAFMDDVIGLAIGPLFVLAELIFLMGLRKPLEEKMLIEAKKLRSEMDQKSLKAVNAD